ncbi:MAG: hypothetical protein K0Q68_1959, partial [Moraxellaceae bacterium]|nr:hypothetical protein [Moraxellaceae bacterium]
LQRLARAHATAQGAAGAEARDRIRRLQGVLHWNIRTGYDQRLTDAWVHLRELDADVARLQALYAGYVRTRQAATHSYQGYDARIGQARTRISAARENVAGLLARQGKMLETLAINELEQRRGRLEEHQVKARFAMAESYDRALKAQQSAEVRAK